MSHFKPMLIVPLVLLCAPACAAQDIAQGAEKGMVVVRDTQSGQLRAPTAAELRGLQQQQAQHMQRSSARLAAPSIVVGPGGRRSVRLGENHLVYSVVTRDSAGKLVEHCLDNTHAAEQVIAQPASATEPEGHAHERR